MVRLLRKLHKYFNIVLGIITNNNIDYIGLWLQNQII